MGHFVLEHSKTIKRLTAHTNIFRKQDLSFKYLTLKVLNIFELQITTAFPIIHKKEFNLKLTFASLSPEARQKKGLILPHYHFSKLSFIMMLDKEVHLYKLKTWKSKYQKKKYKNLIKEIIIEGKKCTHYLRFNLGGSKGKMYTNIQLIPYLHLQTHLFP